MKFLRYAQIASVWCVLALGGMSAAHAADAKDLVLKGDAKCTSCHDEADAPGMLARQNPPWRNRRQPQSHLHQLSR